MHISKQFRAFIATLALLAAAAAGPTAGEIIEIRTGQVAGVPGTPPSSDHNGPVDDCFSYIYQPTCGEPLSGSAFTAADFSAARTSPNFAELIAPAGAWLPTLPADPAARWINWNHGTVAGGSGDPPGSTLYACDFAVETSCTNATVECWWAVDDRLGDSAGPNPIGVYLNGVPLPASFSGGGFGAQSYAIATGINLNPGTNTLYVYQADEACVVSGVILSCRITCGQEGEIHGTKYWDQNCDGVRDPGEPGLAGWTISLTGPVNATTTTNANGDYFFVVPPGSYQVTEITQPGWILTDPPGGVHNVSVDCFQLVSGVDFGNCICEEPGQPLPPCVVGWYPFDEGSGAMTQETGAGNNGNLVGAPAWGGGQIGSALAFPTAADYVDATNPALPNFGLGDFTIATWIRTSDTTTAQRTIIDRSASTTGWHLYLDGGKLGIDVGDAATLATFLSSGTTLTDGSWHHVAAVVCRDTMPGQTGDVILYVDGTVDAAFPGGSLPGGSVNANVPLRIGQRVPSFAPNAALNAELDELMLFNCCLDSTEVVGLQSLMGFASGQCYVPTTISACGVNATTTLQICNSASVPRSYTWTIAGLPSGGNCTIPGPTSFAPTAGTVTLPPGYSCTTIPISIALPPGLTGTNVACYQVTIYENDTGRCFTCSGDLRAPTWLWASPSTPVGDLPVGQLQTVEFELENIGPDLMVFDYELRPWSRGGNGPSPTLSLDGLPPGEPVVRTVKLPPEITVPVTVGVTFEDFQAFNLHEVQLRGDPNGTGAPDLIAVSGLRSVLGSVVAVEPPAPVTPVAMPLRVAPNPFAVATSLRFDFGRQQAASIRIYDVAGRLVRTLFRDRLAAGSHVVTWDGRHESGRLVPPGVYWMKLESPEQTMTTKVVRLP